MTGATPTGTNSFGYNEVALNELFRVYRKQVYSLQKKDEAIKETITNLAHDLRTPVTAIQGYTQMLLQSPELSEEDLDAAAVINERLNVLNQLHHFTTFS